MPRDDGIREIRPGESDPLKRLRDIFSEWSLRSAADVEALTSARRKQLDSTIFAWFAGYRERIISELRELRGLNLCLRWPNKYKSYTHGSAKGAAVKKAVMLSESTVITVPGFRHPGILGRSVPTSWYLLALEFWALVSTGMLRIFPESMTNLVGPSLEGPNFTILRRGPPSEVEWFLLSEQFLTLKNIAFSNAELRKQMHEVAWEQYPGPREVYIYLPHLAGVSPDLLARLRNDYPEAFALYNLTIHRFFEDSEAADDERKLLDVICRTDEELRRIEGELGRLSRRGSVQACGAIVKVSVAALCAFLPDPYLASKWKELLALLAGSGALSNMTGYISTKAEKAALGKESAFYFPWLIHQMGKRGK